MASNKKHLTVEVTDFNFSSIINDNSMVVIDCWAAWCLPCRMISPIIDQLAEEFSGKILFGKLNVDNEKKVPLKYNIMSIPTILFFKNGDLIEQIVGVRSKEDLKTKLSMSFSI